ncbi:hypothetical protein [Mycolicibacterium vanbaalenii]|uniref:hypothetical protein n=1 Tax=Mycolicibacterium vanbaalenii TaxID=110539 RepID=UPI0023BABCC3|nr:hypothetical protein [Mycolicibacterium vanbaalenii]
MDIDAAKVRKESREQKARHKRLLAEFERRLRREVAKGDFEPSRQAPCRGHTQGTLSMPKRLACKAAGLVRFSSYHRMPPVEPSRSEAKNQK